MRISGLASGIDTESLIKDIMDAERIPVDRVFQQKVQAEWKRDAYRDINTKLMQLRTNAFDLRLQSTFTNWQVTSTNENAVSASQTGQVDAGDYTIEVKSLAESASFVSAEGVEEAWTSFIAAKLPEGSEENLEIALQGLEGEDPEVVTIKAGDTLEDFITQINEKENLGFTAYYDSYVDKLVLRTEATGETAEIKVINDDYDFFKDVMGTAIIENQPLARGENAQLTINGLDTWRDSNTFDLNGLTVTLHEASESPVRLSVSQDVDATVDKIKGFVDLYNEIIGELNIKLREPVNRDYPPLTDAERNALSDTEVERWEEAAKSGLLRSDAMISGILSNMRTEIGSAGLSQIGITTGNWQEYGMLHIDESKLRDALTDDLENVVQIFTNSESGLAGKLSGVLDDGMERVANTAGRASNPYDQSFLGEQIRRYEDRISTMEDRLVRVENRYWSQFIAMERALSELHAQSDWLYQQLATLQG